ncbi:F-box associated interaction domain [Arabidopsis thaliana x Arabidopsis arenosa]|uniref:F-box associated interaction domain n=1 Tax=Arabidopsis thaliana x Arabidopsis arenosa TaxID=1240361 RepID=A0A8T1ZMH0_9BRAS|nr:F-box associated interaction domain [Arabidopsis thaliana x Arabidopsis arenosa]
MGFSFRLAAVKGLRKKEIRSTADEFERPRKRRRVMNSKPCGFENLTDDLLMDILARLPAKEVTRSMCVSQLWYTVISSRVFINLFLESPSSTKRQRLILSIVDKDDPDKYGFLSSSSSSPRDHSDTSVSVLDQYLKMPGLGGYVVNALRGLLCVRLGRRVRICNLTTKQRVTLPIIRSSLLAEHSDNIWSYFGHDPVHDEYKVLSTTWIITEEHNVRSEHQVLVLGPGASWRSTQSRTLPPPHHPFSQGIAINGMLYYGAWVDANKCVLMSFDLTLEEFNLIELPVEAGIIWHTYRANLVNYRGKLAVFEYSKLEVDASVDLWVMEDVKKKKWSKNTLVLPLSQMNFVHGDQLVMQGTSRCGELRLGLKNLSACQPSRSEKALVWRDHWIIPASPPCAALVPDMVPSQLNPKLKGVHHAPYQFSVC